MKMNRRKFVKAMGAGSAAVSINSAVLLSSCSSTPETKPSENDLQILYIGDSIAIANTQYGRVKGYILRDVYTFLGIPYGDSTAGKNRFMPPQEPESWDGIRPTVFYGDTAPQNMQNRFPNNYGTFADHWNYYDVSEDCLYLNVWTPGINDGQKRPVLVWFHGGGFTNGNAIEQDSYHGENLSKYGNIVFCSVNHRLGPIGFSDLSAVGDERYKDSGNAGTLDMVAALKWVNKNIASFGGDPSNVTIMGQSGGGAKVCTLVAMNETKGLIHKAVALSGNITGAVNTDYSRELGKYILREAGLTSAQIGRLHDIPWQEYLQLANKATQTMAKEKGESGMMRGSFGPVGDGIHVPTGTFYSDPDSPSADIPMIFSSTFNEFSPSRTNAEMEKMTQDELIKRVEGMNNKNAKEIVAAYSNAFPQMKPIEMLTLIISSRVNIVKAADAKIVQKAPVYMSWFGWYPPLFDNRMRAFHCLDISFWFRNTDKMLTHTGGGSRPRKLAEKMSEALLSFMRTGKPSANGLPEWSPYSKEIGEVMILNDTCEMKNDPDREARLLL